MLRVIKATAPRWLVLENVYGILNLHDGDVFEEIATHLEREGYQIQAFCLPASAANGWHRRDRIWIIGCNPDIPRLEGQPEQSPSRSGEYKGMDDRSAVGEGQRNSPAHAKGSGHGGSGGQERTVQREDLLQGELTGSEMGDQTEGRHHTSEDTVSTRAGKQGRKARNKGRGTARDREEGIRQGDGPVGSDGTDTADRTVGDTEHDGLSASEVGRTHREGDEGGQEGQEEALQSEGSDSLGAVASDTDSGGLEGADQEGRDSLDALGQDGTPADTDSEGYEGDELGRASSEGLRQPEPYQPAPEPDKDGRDDPDTDSLGQEECEVEARAGQAYVPDPDTDSLGDRRYGGEGLEEKSASRGGPPLIFISQDENWLEVAAALCRMDDGLPAELDKTDRTRLYQAVKHFGREEVERIVGWDLSAIEGAVQRTHRLKALGNSVYVPLVRAIFESIREAESDE